MDKLDLEAIEKYLERTLGQDELQAFEARLAYDQELQKEVNFQKDIQRSLLLKQRAQTKELLKGFDETEEVVIQPVIGKPVRRFRIGNIAVAASFILLAAFAAVFTLNSSKNSKKLLATNYSPYENVVHQITRSEGDQLLKDFAFNAYEAGNYATADSLLQQLYAEEQDPSFLLYSSISQLELNNYDKAVKQLEEFVVNTDHPLYEVGNWYLALAHLGNRDKDASKTILKSIKEKDYKYENAQKLLKKLN